jgi:predicted helicase
MRWSLLNSFDEIYLLDLHGNAKKKDISPDGTPDKNVFDIQQGVSIIVAVRAKTGAGRRPLATVRHADLWGDRAKKYNFLERSTLASVKWKTLKPEKPDCFFVPRDNTLLAEYRAFPSLLDIMKTNVLGFQTHRDDFAVAFERQTIASRMEDLRDGGLSDNDVRLKYGLKDNRDWHLKEARQTVRRDENWKRPIMPCAYRPFDERYCYFSEVAMDYPRRELLDHVGGRENLSLLVSRQQNKTGFRHVWITDGVAESCVVSLGTREQNYVFPLWLYNGALNDGEKRRANFDAQVFSKFSKIAPGVIPETLIDYIYAVLHSPDYRQRYGEFLKSDFPRIPYPKDKKTFSALAKNGAALRKVHLMEDPELNKSATTYPVAGDHVVKKPRFDETGETGKGRVWINETQYFGNVAETTWNFYIGGYQPAQKWLKDRRGRPLSRDEIKHWQRIGVALAETDKIMKKIDESEFLP